MATIAEVLHYAADHCLWDGESTFLSESMWLHSCNSVRNAAEVFGIPEEIILHGLENMGVDSGSGMQFLGVKNTQGARYMWLKFAALIAEEQGV